MNRPPFTILSAWCKTVAWIFASFLFIGLLGPIYHMYFSHIRHDIVSNAVAAALTGFYVGVFLPIPYIGYLFLAFSASSVLRAHNQWIERLYCFGLLAGILINIIFVFCLLQSCFHWIRKRRMTSS